MESHGEQSQTPAGQPGYCPSCGALLPEVDEGASVRAEASPMPAAVTESANPEQHPPTPEHIAEEAAAAADAREKLQVEAVCAPPPEPTQAGASACVSCGRVFDEPDARFCEKCGAPRVLAGQESSAAAAAKAAPFCTKCGAAFANDAARFCRQCGAARQ